ncbi:MAG TPA: lysozyme [Verrucomicrobiae bacterium]|nr:lysozyme [Verrucomicrobiae bacterium]
MINKVFKFNCCNIGCTILIFALILLIDISMYGNNSTIAKKTKLHNNSEVDNIVKSEENIVNQINHVYKGNKSIENMNASSKLVKFITNYEGNAGMTIPLEGLENDTYGLYNDPEGNCTVGIGHLVHFGNCTEIDIEKHKKGFPNGERKTDALRILKKDLIFIENDIKNIVKVPLSQQQFDALVDFDFNEGLEKLKASKLLRDVNKGNFDNLTIQKDFLEITRDGLLIDRRMDESNMFNYGIYNQ